MKIVLLLVFIFVVYSNRLYSQSSAQQRFHMLREIGNDFLLQLNDSTSRILPVKRKAKDIVLNSIDNFQWNQI